MDHKTCTKCKEEKQLSEFAIKNKITGKRNSICKKCFNIYQREHYKNNKITYLEKNDRNREKIREYINKVKTVPCTDCKNTFPPCVMDFDHQYDKDFNISEAANRCMSIEKIAAEIAKCEIVCANCHRLRTHSKPI